MSREGSPENGAEGSVAEDMPGATTATLVRLLVEQQRVMNEQQERAREQHQQALEQQTVQQRMLLEIVEQQKGELLRYREEMNSILRKGEEAAAKPKIPKPTMQKLGDKDDIEHFLATFERIATQQGWPKEVWAMQLAGLLTGKALAAYAAGGSEESTDYEKVKTAILHRYEVNDETRRQRFRQGMKRPEESYRAWVCRTTDYFDRWMKDQKLTVREVVIMEQILLGVPEEMVVWLKERKPESLEQLGKLADDYVLARKSEGVRSPRPTAPGFYKVEAGNPPSQVREERRRPVANGERTQVNFRGDKRCYSCGRWGHLSYSCPNKRVTELKEGQNWKGLFAGACEDVAWNEDSQKYLKRGTVDGKPVQMLVDTGCDRTIISARVVKTGKLDPGNKVPVLCVHGDTCSYPTARVKLTSGSWVRDAEVAVAPNLPVAVLLGRDLYEVDVGGENDGCAQGLVAMTRSRSKMAEQQRERGHHGQLAIFPCSGNGGRSSEWGDRRSG